MEAVGEQIKIDEWRGLYKESWKGVIVDEAFAHPAKFSRALIQRIYEHVIEEGWANKGDSVVDPFGGVALGAFPAMQHGLVWYGCELEEKFVALGNQNIDLWNERYSRMPNWGSAHLLQGDSRKLIEVLSAAGCCVSSPPYTGSALGHDAGCVRLDSQEDERREREGIYRRDGYGAAGGQLGAMKEGDHALAITSPPYHGNEKHDSTRQERSERVGKTQGRGSFHSSAADYGTTEGQLGAMPEGQIAITSPPYAGIRQDGGKIAKENVGGMRPYSDDPVDAWFTTRDQSNLGNLRDDANGFQAAISSPPYEGCELTRDTEFADKHHHDIGRNPNGAGAKGLQGQLSNNAENLGNQRGETFWSASRLILEQLHQVIIPGGHAVFVVKAFVRDKKIVDFPAQWAQLCEAVGFKLLHDHHALLTEHYGTQGGFDEDKKLSVERKSFFRRLAESKGSPRIDHENVLCFERVD